MTPDGEENQEDTDQAQGRRWLPPYFATFHSPPIQRFQKKQNKTKQKNNPWVRLTWKKVLRGRNDETRHLALVLAHCVTFGKFLPFSEPQLTQLYNGDNMARPHLTSVYCTYEFEFLAVLAAGAGSSLFAAESSLGGTSLGHPRLPVPRASVI